MNEFRAAIERLEAPAAPRDLIGRVAAERARGVRKVIPGGAEAVPPRVGRAFLAGLAALLVIGVVLIEQWPLGAEPGADLQSLGACDMNGEARSLLAAGSFFLAAACAQEPGDSPYEPAPAVRSLDLRGLRPGTLVYHVGNGQSEPRRQVFLLARAGTGDRSEWQSVSTTDFRDGTGGYTDTLRYAADGVTPVRQAIHIRRHDTDLWATEIAYRPAGVEVVSDYLGYAGNPPQRRRWVSELPLGAVPILPAVHGPGIVHLVRQLPLAAGWAGSVQAGPFGSTGFRVAALRVTGEENVHVPAGTFECWRLSLAYERGGGYVLWVTKGEQLLVKVLSGSEDQGVETVLVSFEPAG